jgi:hypothetical protein
VSPAHRVAEGGDVVADDLQDAPARRGALLEEADDPGSRDRPAASAGPVLKRYRCTSPYTIR